MAPKKHLQKNEAAAKEIGLTPMACFFKVKKQKGRPFKKVLNAGRPTSSGVSSSPAVAIAAAPPSEPSEQKKVKLTRQNWSKGEGLKRMSEAVEA